MGDHVELYEAQRRIARLKAQIGEMEDAYEAKDLTGYIDGLTDLIYFAFGGFIRMGIPPAQIGEIFDAVHSVNMQKVPGVKKGREGFDGVADAVKSEDVLPAEVQIAEVLKWLKSQK